MLMPEQVIPFLLHDDPSVRSHALRYFRDPDPAGQLTADHYWAIVDRYGMETDHGSVMVGLNDPRQTENSYQRLMQSLSTGLTVDSLWRIESALRKLDFALLRQHRDEVLACNALSEKVREHLKLRLTLSELTPEALWNRLMNHGQAVGCSNAGEFPLAESSALVDALSRNHAGIGPLALATLGDPEAQKDWREIFAAQVLGAIRFEPAIDALVAKLNIDADVLRERVVDALSHIGSVEVIEKIEAFYPGKEWHVRLYADGPLSRIKRPESEAALLRLIAQEEEDDRRISMLIDLCELCSLAGLEWARTMIDQYPGDPEADHLCESMLAVATMLEVSLPEEAEWRRRTDARRGRVAASANLFKRFFRGGGLGSRTPGMNAFSVDAPASASLPLPIDVAPTPVIRREAPKVGRNDPCPCGSGKKYKKCCLDKSVGV